MSQLYFVQELLLLNMIEKKRLVLIQKVIFQSIKSILLIISILTITLTAS